jgi:hypothetical protein
MKNQKIIKICEQKFIYLNYSDRTKDNYILHIKRFLESLGNKQIIHCNSSNFNKTLTNFIFMVTPNWLYLHIINNLKYLKHENI